jgi:hypothetical protein
VEGCANVAGRTFEIRGGLLLDPNDGDLVPEAPRPLEDQKGKSAVAGNEADPAHAPTKESIRGGSTDGGNGPAAVRVYDVY